MGDSVDDIKIGDIIQVLGEKSHISMHIVVGLYIEEGEDEFGLKEEKMVSTYTFYCNSPATNHMKINKIWNMPLENYLSRSPNHKLRIFSYGKDKSITGL